VTFLLQTLTRPFLISQTQSRFCQKKIVHAVLERATRLCIPRKNVRDAVWAWSLLQWHWCCVLNTRHRCVAGMYNSNITWVECDCSEAHTLWKITWLVISDVLTLAQQSSKHSYRCNKPTIRASLNRHSTATNIQTCVTRYLQKFEST